MTEVAWRAELTDTEFRDELDRRHPERIKLRATDVAGLRQAFDVVEEIWAPTFERARRLSPAMLHERVNGEYSFVETFRHLLFAWEAWLRHKVLRVPDGYHRWAIPPELPADAPRRVMYTVGVGWTSSDDAPDLDPVLDVRAELFAQVRDFLSGATAEDINAPGSPPPWHPGECSILYCLRVILHEEWWHHQFAIRDLAVLERSA